ncbi:tRNA-dihydrouridine synthase B [Candidatus Methanobinarius endosymbioticus]|uniref:tRNA-dihydrouridine synthase B n=1 Tax=Candidatus Methanobinarius endosymbioticus TaxID=2006182 RepID=A0A366MBD6_9EURY|nr:tRNA-dihydrouridine synthase B [Candidatus Methanobinarius endosymbioticus]
MAGITDGKFALKLIPYGFDVVSIGGYNADSETIAAGKKILERGRNEFDIELEKLYSVIENEVNIIKKRYPHIKVSLNLRAISPESIIAISDIINLDIIEINSHCRQEELLKINCGQQMLQSPHKLANFTKKVVDGINPNKKVSVKMRANVNGVDDLKIAKKIENTGVDYLHIDAIKPGHLEADLNIIREISENTEIFIIGNNSIVDVKRGKEMLDAGASGISVARAAINGKLNFDISKI